MQAGEERGGVACRSFQHTLALLLALESHLAGVAAVPPLAAGRRRHRGPARHRGRLAPRLAELLLGPHGTHVVAPARRISSAYQSALMLREGPRLPAVGCETGDWSHVDVYLTKTTDYRMLLLGGSRWEPQLLDWTGAARQHGRRRRCRRARRDAYDPALPHDDDDDVRLLTETLVAELLAARAWQAGQLSVGSTWSAASTARNGSRARRASSTVRMVHRSGRRSGSSSSSQSIGTETGAPAAGPGLYGATRVLLIAFWV